VAGSLNHLVDDDGNFTLDTIENEGDAAEALEECFGLIAHLTGGNHDVVAAACRKLGYPIPAAGLKLPKKAPPTFPVRTAMTLGRSKNENVALCEQLGLFEPESEAWRMFRYACCELTVEVEVNEDGTVHILGTLGAKS